MAKHLWGVSRTPAPIALGNTWMFLGDSQTAGRATGNAISPPVAFRAIWDAKFTAPSTQVSNGVSGGSLAETNAYYATQGARTSATFVYFQESGNQNQTGQTTAAAYGDTFDAFITEIIGNTPSAVIYTETAFSFGREGESFRDWTTYNAKLYERVAAWALLGTTIIVGPVAANVAALDAALSPSQEWYQTGHADAYHYTEIGNLLVALTLFKKLNIPIVLADLSPITEVTSGNKQACLDVIALNL